MIHIVLLANILGANAFSLPTRIGISSRTNRGTSCLFVAKKQPKKSRSAASSGSGGGFGKAATGSVAVVPVDDYAVFPALDQQVQDSLIPSPLELQQVGALPMEVYDRLDKIYGFPNFNYPSSIPNEDKFSLNDLIMSPPTDPAALLSSSSTSTTSKLDMGNLLASPSLQDGSGRETTASLSSKNKMEAIANLPQFDKFRVLHVDPLVLAIDDFFTNDVCDRYIAMSQSPTDDKELFQTRSKTVGKDSISKAQRTSTTWFHHYKNVPELMSKASRLLGLDGIDHWEEAQTVRYRRNEKFTWHLDALAPAEASPTLGGQRTATLLVYLTDLGTSDGGATIFRDLSETTSAEGGMLKVQPKKGSALLFFPAAGGIPNTPYDIRTLHCGEAVDESSSNDKWISQLWLRETPYTPSAPSGNKHEIARTAIENFCRTTSGQQ